MTYQYHHLCESTKIRNGRMIVCRKPGVAYWYFSDGARMSLCQKHLNRMRRETARFRRRNAPPAGKEA